MLIDSGNILGAELKNFSDWLNGDVAKASLPADRQQEIRSRIQALRNRLEQPPVIPIALLGSTGAGKSTLINTILGSNVLNSNNLQFCTAAVTAVSYESRAGYRARLTFLSLGEWNQEVENVLKYLYATDSGSPEDTDLTSSEIRRHYEKKLRTVYKLDPASPIPRPLPPLPSHVQDLLSRDSALELNSADLLDMRKRLKEYVTSDGSLWPLVQLAEILGPFEALSGGIQLVDLPGLNDPNPAREEITRSYLKQSPFVWLIFNSKRGLTKDVRDFLIETNLVRQMMLDGNLPGFAMVATHADDIDIDEQTLENLALPEDATESEIVAERNRRVVSICQSALRDLAANIGARAHASEQEVTLLANQLAGVPVFAIASKSYQKAKGLAPKSRVPDLPLAQTEVPALLEHLRGVAHDKGRETHFHAIKRELDLLIQETEVFFRSQLDELAAFAQSSRQRRQQLRDVCTLPQERHKSHLAAIQSNVESSFRTHREAFEDRLNSAAREAKSRVNQTVEQWRSIHHNTLLATVMHEGRFRSSNGTLYDLNQSLAEPLLQAIPFAWNDFFSVRLDNTLSLLSEQLRAEADSFLKDVEIAALRSKLDDEGLLDALPGSLDTAKRSVEIQTEGTRQQLDLTVRQVRSDLATGIETAAQAAMKPAYRQTAAERGAGMKARILRVLSERAQSQVLTLFDTIRTELSEGVITLGGQLSQQTGSLRAYVDGQTDRVLTNLTQTDSSSSPIEERRRLAESAIHELAPFRGQVTRAGSHV
jgi:hypothetical protein